MTRHPRRVLAAALAATLTAGLTSCSLDPPRDSAPPALPGARTGGTLRVGIVAPGPIDPANAVTPGARMITTAMCDTLLQLDPETRQAREGITQNWVPAESGAFTTFRLVHGVTFNDGTPVKSTDIVASVKAVHAGVNASPFRTFIDPFDAGVLGPRSDGTDPNANQPLLVEAGESGPDPITALNDYDLQLFGNPSWGLATVRAFAEPALAPMSQASLEKGSAAVTARPVCVGPYRLAEPYHSGDKEIVLERTPGYFGKNNGYTRGGRGYVDRIVFTVFPDYDAIADAFGKGEVDVAEIYPGQFADGGDALRAMQSLTMTPGLGRPAKNNPGAQKPGKATGKDGATAGRPDGTGAIPTPEPPRRPPLPDRDDIVAATPDRIEYIGFPAGVGRPWDKPEVRRALSLALDRTTLAKQVLGPGAGPALGVLPPSLSIEPGRGNSQDQPGLAVRGCGDHVMPARADITRAKQILADAGVDLKGKTLTVAAGPSMVADALIRAAGRQWRDAFGMKLQVTGYSLDEFTSTATVGAGFSTPFRISWSSSAVAPVPMYHDPQPYFQAMYSQSGIAQGNWARWSSAAVEDDLSVGLIEAGDITDRQRIFNQMADLVCRELPTLPTVTSGQVWLVSSDRVTRARAVVTGVDGQLLLRELAMKE